MEKPWLTHYDRGVPRSLTYPKAPLYQLLEKSAARQPDATCTIFFGREESYGQIREQSDRLALALDGLGVRPGERVALLLPNCPQYVIAYYAILKAGAVVVALNPLANEKELTHLLNDAQAQTLITIPMFLERVASFQAETPLRRIIDTGLAEYMPLPLSALMRIREWRQRRAAAQAGGAETVAWQQLLAEADPADFRPAEVDPDGLAVLLYSGGTTGVAKGIMLSHYACMANAYQIQSWGELTPDDRILTVLPLFHGYGMSVNMNACLLAGGQTILVPRFDAGDVLKLIEKQRPTFFTGVPTMFVAFSNLPQIETADLSSLKGIFVGAAPLTRAIKDEFERKTGGRMIEGYGLTEAVTAIMANPYQGRHKLGSIGIPFPDVVARIGDLETAEPVAPGEPGEILLQSPTLMLGYYDRPEETAEALRNGWLHTGDIGYMDEDGYFYITDRKKDLIIVGGFNVFPREIEEVLYQHPKVKEGVALGIPDEYAGERIKVFVTLKEGESATEEELIAHFREHLTRYKVPAAVEFRDALPKSMIGKILRRELREK